MPNKTEQLMQAPMKRKRKVPKKPPRLTDGQPKKVTRFNWADLNPKIRKVAEKAAEGDHRRVEFITPDDVIIHNHRNWGK